jgi:hypothetical protein
MKKFVDPFGDNDEVAPRGFKITGREYEPLPVMFTVLRP